LVSHVPSQIDEFNDRSFDDLKKTDIAKKPLEDEGFSGALIPSYNEEDNQSDDDIDKFCLVGRCRWDIDCWFFHKEPIYDTDSESLMMEGTNLHFPFSASLEDNFMRYENSYSDFISLDLGQPKDVEVDGALVVILGQHSFDFSREKDVLTS
jgi:hypothetical protein